MYKIWHISNSPQDFVFSLFSTCSSLFFFVLITRDFCNWGHHNQIALWRIPWHSKPLTTKALGAGGKSYGACEEGTLLGLLQALANMWSFFRCRFLEGDTSSLWYEFGAKNVDKKAPDARLFLCFDWTKVVTPVEVSDMGDLFFPKIQA